MDERISNGSHVDHHTKRMRDNRARLAPVVLLTGVSAIASAAIFFRLAGNTHPLVMAGTRLAIASTLLSPVVVLSIRSGRLPVRHVREAIIGGVLYAVHFGSWVWSLQLTTVAASVTLVTATPLFLAIHAVVTGRDRPDRALWVSLAVAAVGVTIIGGTDLGSSMTALVGDGLALVGAVSIAAYMVRVRALGEVAVLPFMGVAAGVGGVILLLVAWSVGIAPHPESWESLGWLFAAALVPQLIGHTCITWCLRHMTPTTVGVATLFEPVGSTAVAWWLLSETPKWGTLTGCAITLAAVAIALTTRRRRNEPATDAQSFEST
jgi:drug/metabolite transporter (DMT)-like permease